MTQALQPDSCGVMFIRGRLIINCSPNNTNYLINYANFYIFADDLEVHT